MGGDVAVKLWISHSGHADPQWFIVQPNPQGLEAELSSLRRAGRTVIGLDVEPYANSERMRALYQGYRAEHKEDT